MDVLYNFRATANAGRSIFTTEHDGHLLDYLNGPVVRTWYLSVSTQSSFKDRSNR